ncbi:Calmodulin-like protein 11 [Glycine soja]
MHGQKIKWLYSMKPLTLLTRTPTETQQKKKIQEMISEVDINGNSLSVNFEDFLKIMGRTIKENLTEELKDSFKVFDRDNDGYISATELRQVMVKLGERLTDEEVEQMIREADLDGDGRDSYEKFLRFMTLN